jgi:ElaB/YqjD/DUF883 family membrane-anchored ribosome-binding protein
MAETSNRGSSTRESASSGQFGGSGVGQKAQDTASNLTQRASDVASGAAQKAQDLASSAGQRADSALSSVGQGMSSLAGTLRENAPHEGFLGSAASTVADQLRSGGEYLEQHGLSDIAGDLTSLIRSHPMPAVCVAFGVGWLIGMASRR